MHSSPSLRAALAIATLSALLPGLLAAETVIRIHDRPLSEIYPQGIPKVADQSAGSATGVPHKREVPSTFFILHHIKIDSTSNSGETSLLAIRNEVFLDRNLVTIQIFESDTAATPDVIQRNLNPYEVWTLNLRQQIGDNLPTDPDGFKRGWARITAEGPISADFFQIDPGNDFAAGGALADVNDQEFCTNVKLRFLVGGAFTGGTVLTFMQDQPLGGNPNTDPPSITGEAFRESGEFLNSFEIFTDDFSFQRDASDLVMGANFGSLNMVFQNPLNGGFARAEHKADGRYSVSLKSTCLDPIIPDGFAESNNP